MKHIIAQVLYTPADFYPIFLEYRYKNISFTSLQIKLFLFCTMADSLQGQYSKFKLKIQS